MIKLHKMFQMSGFWAFELAFSIACSCTESRSYWGRNVRNENETHQLSTRLSAHGMLIFLICSPSYSADSMIAEFQYILSALCSLEDRMYVEGMKVTLRKVRVHGRPLAEDVKLWTLVSILKNQMT